MAILKIAKMGHPVLAQRARPVPDPTAPEIRQLVSDMLETMEDAGGTGLAAPQVHVPLRVIIFEVDGGRASREDAAEHGGVPLTVLVNPEIEPLSQDMSLGWEACLSVPGLAGMVPRYDRILYRGLAPDGSEIAREAIGFHARVVQHEADHLDGILYPQRMTDLKTLVFSSELRHQGKAASDEGGERRQ